MSAVEPTASTPTARSIARLGASAALLVALIGATIGGHLAALRLTIEASPCAASFACAGGPCADALSSPWGALLGVPLGGWALAFYGVVVVVAAGAWRRGERFLRGLAPRLLLALGLAAIAASAVMATIGSLTLEGPCQPCLGLHGAAVLLFVSALLLLFGSPRPRPVHPRDPVVVEALFSGAALFVALLGAQALSAPLLRAGLAPPRACPEAPRLAQIPPAAIVFGDDAPAVVIAAFLDPASPASRDEFRALTGLLGRRALPAPAQLRLYHYPREAGGCAPGDLPLRFARFSVESTQSHACQASLAIECVEALAPGLGIRMAGAIYDLQDGPIPYFTPVTLARAARSVGLAVDPEDASNPLFRCLADDAAALRRVRAHLRFAARYGAREAPHGYVIRVTDGRLDLGGVEAYRGRLSEALLRRKIESVLP